MRSRFLAVLVLVALTGCTPVAPTTNPGPDSIGDVPAFEGPWAEAFAQAWLDASTDEQRAILADGKITDAEYADVRQGLVDCIAGFGATVTLGPYGTFSIDPGGLSDTQLNDDILPECEQQTVGQITFLYEQLARNPQNRDEAELMVECLRRVGVVGPAYSAAQWRADSESQTGLDWDDPRIRQCGLDPLGASG